MAPPPASRRRAGSRRWCVFTNPITAQPYERDPLVHLVETQHAIGATVTATTRCGRHGEVLIVAGNDLHLHYRACPACQSRTGARSAGSAQRPEASRLRWLRWPRRRR